MKRFVFILLVLLSSRLSAQQVIIDSLDFSLMVAEDTAIFQDIGKIRAGTLLSCEMVYTGLDADSAYTAICFSNTGNTLNFATELFGASSDSVRLDTAYARITNGNDSRVTGVATPQKSIMFVGDKIFSKHMILWFRKGDVTSGKVYYYILKL